MPTFIDYTQDKNRLFPEGDDPAWNAIEAEGHYIGNIQYITKWANVHFGDVKVEPNTGWHHFEVLVYLNRISPDAMHVELYADKSNSESLEKFEMNRDQQLVGAENGYILPTTRQPSDFSARMVHHFKGLAIPLEEAHILWQR